MLKERKYSIDNDFQTGLFSKITFILGVFLLILYLFFKIIAFFYHNSTGLLKDIYNISISSTTDTIGAFSIIFIAVSIILYFFKKQFNKLSEIAEEIENENKDGETK
jgi:amino acid transporter